jgi:LuxR family transcriptional regulator, maltose regulon positive regulatory protein
VLRHRLHTERAAQSTGLHRRASQWYAAHGYQADAVRHALAASDWDRAAELILGGTSTELLKRGELMTLLRWLGAFPEPIVRASPRLCCEYAWPLILTGQVETAEAYIDQAAAIDEALVRRVLFEHTPSARQQGGNPPEAAPSEEALALLSPDRLPERGLVLLNLAMARWYQGRLAEAEEMLAEAQVAARRSGDTYAWLTASIFLNKALIDRGKLRQAATACAKLISQDVQAPIIALAYNDLAALHREWNELDVAATYATEGLRQSDQGGCGDLQAACYSTLALVRQAQGQVSAACEALRQAGEIHQDCGPSPAGRLYYQTVRILVALGQGDLETAALAVEQIPAPEAAKAASNYLELCLARAQFLLAKGQRKEAAGEMIPLYETARRTGWQVYAVRARALQSLATVRSDEALPLLAEALAMAEPAGFVRTFLDLGEPMRALLEQCLTRGIMVDHVSRLLRSFAASAEAGSGTEAAFPATGPQAHGLVEAISERELEVIHLLAGGLTNQELADRLYISGNTVKTHLASIYGKLGVGGRREAIAAARRAGLLP